MSTEAVNNVAESLEKTHITTPQTNEADVAHAASAAEGRRLYIGNLAYSTTEEQLKEFFQDFAVESVSIPTNPRTSRAVGYAFVDFHKKEEADRAITELSGKELLGRKVSVQAARKPGAHNAGVKEGETPGEGQEKRGRGKPGNRRRFRGRGGFKNRGTREGETEEAEGTPAATGSAPAATTDAAATTATPKETSAKQNENTPAASADGQNGFKGRRKRGPPEDGVPSKTKVMVANLPYELSEEKLKELFAAYNPESAKIALRPIRPFMVRILAARGEARKGRGFGFVTLGSEELQQKAIAEMNGKLIEGREIAVKVAIDNPKLEAEAEAKAAAESEATKEAAKEASPKKEESPKAENKVEAPKEASPEKTATNGVKAEAKETSPTTTA